MADCGLQGTATSPSSTAKTLTKWRKGWDLNPRGRVTRLRALQARLISRSSTLPLSNIIMAEGVGFEPTAPDGARLFESRTIDRSDTPP
jgi:hypothetical protein